MAKSFKALTLVRAKTAGALLSGISAMGELGQLEIIDLHHVAGFSHALLAFLSPVSEMQLRSCGGEALLLELSFLQSPQPDFLDYYLHLKLDDEQKAKVTVFETSDYFALFNLLNEALQKKARAAETLRSAHSSESTVLPNLSTAR